MIHKALQCRGVTKTFIVDGEEGGIIKRIRNRKNRFRAVDDISFTVEAGEIFGIIGPNGSGKSTLIRLISTLLLPNEGYISVFGNDVVKDSRKVRRLINRVTVEASFFKKLSALENLSYAARLYDVPIKEAREKIEHILGRLQFPTKKLKEPLENLSRGMQQKVAIARALFTRPTLLLLDEPTTGLDPRSKREVQAFVREAQSEFGATILFTTHDMEEAESICGRIAIIKDGRFVALDTAEGLKRLAGNGTGKELTMEDVFFILTGEEWEGEEDKGEGEVMENAGVN